MKKQLQKGFTLIELMIVVAIIGILAAIAIPAYQDYIARSQVSESVSLMSGAKTPLAEFWSDKGAWPTALSSVAGTTSGKYVEEITGAPGGSPSVYVMTAKMRSSGVNQRVSGKTISMSTREGTSWSCGVGGATPVDAKYLPGACR
jgi:type IV pilus assembly protein PilA